MLFFVWTFLWHNLKFKYHVMKTGKKWQTFDYNMNYVAIHHIAMHRCCFWTTMTAWTLTGTKTQRTTEDCVLKLSATERVSNKSVWLSRGFGLAECAMGVWHRLSCVAITDYNRRPTIYQQVTEFRCSTTILCSWHAPSRDPPNIWKRKHY